MAYQKVIYKKRKPYHRMKSGRLMEGRTHPRSRQSSGVPIQYKEKWNYFGTWTEKPIKRLPSGKKLWRFRFKAKKSRPAKSYGSMGKGSYGRWKIAGYQDIKKTGKGKYTTDFKGYKTPVFFVIKKPKKRF